MKIGIFPEISILTAIWGISSIKSQWKSWQSLRNPSIPKFSYKSVEKSLVLQDHAISPQNTREIGRFCKTIHNFQIFNEKLWLVLKKRAISLVFCGEIARSCKTPKKSQIFPEKHKKFNLNTFITIFFKLN
jgi:hypothetical protein